MTTSEMSLRATRRLRRAGARLLHPWRRRVALRRLTRGPTPNFVLVVCHGNLCRSPYAAELLRRGLRAVAGRPVRVGSAGYVGLGRPCPDAALEIAALRGVDLSGHRSQVLTPPDVNAADLIVVMDTAQHWGIRAIFGRSSDDVIVLGDLDPDPIDTRDILDPIEQANDVFELTYARIERCITDLVRAVSRGAGAAASHRPVGQPGHQGQIA